MLFRSPEGAVAGKTGTTNDQSDGWFIGVVPKLTTAVWVGAEDRQVHFESLEQGQGARMALPIWGIFMKKVYENPSLGFSKYQNFATPPGVVLNLRCTGGDEDSKSATEVKDPHLLM